MICLVAAVALEELLLLERPGAGAHGDRKPCNPAGELGARFVGAEAETV